MATTTQIHKIENLNFEDLNKLIVSILQKKEYKDIEILDDCIKGSQKSLLNNSTSVFISFTKKLICIELISFDKFSWNPFVIVMPEKTKTLLATYFS